MNGSGASSQRLTETLSCWTWRFGVHCSFPEGTHQHSCTALQHSVLYSCWKCPCDIKTKISSQIHTFDLSSLSWKQMTTNTQTARFAVNGELWEGLASGHMSRPCVWEEWSQKVTRLPSQWGMATISHIHTTYAQPGGLGTQSAKDKRMIIHTRTGKTQDCIVCAHSGIMSQSVGSHCDAQRDSCSSHAKKIIAFLLSACRRQSTWSTGGLFRFDLIRQMSTWHLKRPVCSGRKDLKKNVLQPDIDRNGGLSLDYF